MDLEIMAVYQDKLLRGFTDLIWPFKVPLLFSWMSNHRGECGGSKALCPLETQLTIVTS